VSCALRAMTKVSASSMVAIRAVSLTAAPYIGLKYPNLVVTR
jgi:hypothetical protein